MASITGCGQTQETETVRIIVQPVAEINKKITFEIFFNGKPDEGSVQMDSIDGLDIMRRDREFYTTEFSVSKSGEEYWIYTYTTPLKPGKIEIPPVSVKIGGITGIPDLGKPRVALQ
jgi:hypothetical protein